MPSISRRGARFALHPLALAAVLLLAKQSQAADDAATAMPPGAAAPPQTSAAPQLPAVTITGRREATIDSYTIRSTATATKLDLSLRDTPQSISVIPRALMDDFVLNDVNNLLASVTGVNVERVEPDRTYFSVRGFEVSNFQIDGMGGYGSATVYLDQLTITRW